MSQAIGDNELWVLSYYRTSEISGSLFFGRLARSMRPGPLQRDMTKHFADESQHAWYWTHCIETMGGRAHKMAEAYQDQYFEAAGMPVNYMEVLAITHIFERRVINQYSQHLSVPGSHPAVKQTLKTIMKDEKWHIQWVRDALLGMEGEYGRDHVRATLERFQNADQEVYRKTMKEHEERARDLFRQQAAKL
jgi:1,2-phenylacetyl-CoA epoxidase catalytic subunit